MFCPEGRRFRLPTYVYECQQCHTTFERRQSFHDAPLTTHDECGGSVRKVIVPAPVIFKGSGFYNTDYRGSGAGASSKTDGDSGESKSDAKSEAKSEGS